MKQAEFVWLVANLQPVTTAEIAAHRFETDDRVSTVALDCYEHGFVDRTERINFDGKNPYEYTIAPIPEADP